jgi:hypothetical protein
MRSAASGRTCDMATWTVWRPSTGRASVHSRLVRQETSCCRRRKPTACCRAWSIRPI